MILPVPGAWAGDNCQAFRAIIRGTYPTPVQLREGDVWGGEIWASLGGQELLFGQFAGNDGTESGHGMMVSVRGGSYKYDFGANGSFTTEVHAVGTFPPGKIMFGYYMGAAKIAQGTGRFQSASGNIQVAGPFIGWTFDGVNFEARWNAEISGTVCNVSAP